MDLRIHEIQLAFGLKYIKAIIRIPLGAKMLPNAVVCLLNANIHALICFVTFKSPLMSF